MSESFTRPTHPALNRVDEPIWNVVDAQNTSPPTLLVRGQLLPPPRDMRRGLYRMAASETLQIMIALESDDHRAFSVTSATYTVANSETGAVVATGSATIDGAREGIYQADGAIENRTTLSFEAAALAVGTYDVSFSPALSTGVFVPMEPLRLVVVPDDAPFVAPGVFTSADPTPTAPHAWVPISNYELSQSMTARVRAWIVMPDGSAPTVTAATYTITDSTGATAQTGALIIGSDPNDSTIPPPKAVAVYFDAQGLSPGAYDVLFAVTGQSIEMSPIRLYVRPDFLLL